MLDEKDLKKQILSSIDDDIVPDIRHRIDVSKYLKPKKKPWYFRPTFLAPAGVVLTAGVALAIILPNTLGKSSSAVSDSDINSQLYVSITALSNSMQVLDNNMSSNSGSSSSGLTGLLDISYLTSVDAKDSDAEGTKGFIKNYMHPTFLISEVMLNAVYDSSSITDKGDHKEFKGKDFSLSYKGKHDKKHNEFKMEGTMTTTKHEYNVNLDLTYDSKGNRNIVTSLASGDSSTYGYSSNETIVTKDGVTTHTFTNQTNGASETYTLEVVHTKTDSQSIVNAQVKHGSDGRIPEGPMNFSIKDAKEKIYSANNTGAPKVMNFDIEESKTYYRYTGTELPSSGYDIAK
ncbi:MAG: hypothetical protein K6F07_01680 [Bacilli bacterium]|nr:hypothetical protein [Bacilli bacterium]